MSAAATDQADVVAGTLRWSKGAWLLAPTGVDVLLRVEPVPAPSTEGFFSRAIKARLVVHGDVGSTARAGDPIRPRTGVPDVLVGTVRTVGDGFVVVDAGVAFVVRGAVGVEVGAVVTIDVDDDRGIVCELL